MGFRVTEVQPTPNPNAVKFMLDRPISEQPMSYFNAAAAGDHPVAKALFAVPGVTSLLLLGDFITVNKRPEAKWPDVRKQVESVLSEIV
jgi:NFU1 iron-sulfur cluster scaffold homolog, mitochondrial